MIANTLQIKLAKYGLAARIGAVFVLVLLGSLLWSNLANADTATKTRHVKGKATLQFFSGDACLPHVGTCLKGTLTGDLSGEAFIKIFTQNTVPGSQRTVSVATAAISITRPDGRLDGAAAGFTDRGNGDFRNVTPWVGGTGKYESARGEVQFEGVTDFTTGIANETYKGTLILDK